MYLSSICSYKKVTKWYIYTDMCIYTRIYVNLKDNTRIVQENIGISYIAIIQILKQFAQKVDIGKGRCSVQFAD